MKKKYKTLKGIKPSFKVQDDYAKAIIKFISKIEKGLKETQKDSLGDVMDNILLFLLSFVENETIQQIVELFIDKNETFNAKKFDENLGNINLKSIFLGNDLEELLKEKTAINIALIRSIPQKMHDNLQEKITYAFNAGEDIDVQEMLQQQFAVQKKRANFIARDQNRKINSALYQLRAEKNGSEEYEWKTSVDGKERQSHKDLNNKIFKWNKGSGCCGHPSEEPNCRCLARAVFRVF